MNRIKLLIAAVFISILTGCATPISLTEQSPYLDQKSDNKIIISVIDERERLKEGRPNDFIGVAHGTFGIPFDWHVNPVVATEPGDKDKTLSEFLEHRIVTGLKNSGWDASQAEFDEFPTLSQTQQVIEDNGASKLFVLKLHEWFFSINLNWVSAFNFDTDSTVYVYEMENGKVLEQQFKGRDVIEEKSDESYNNLILIAYRDQLQEILNDEKVVSALLQQQ